MNKLLNNPFKWIVAWLIMSLAVTFSLIIVKSMGASDGEQWPLRIIGKAVIIIPSGGLLLGFVCPFFYISWSKRYWYLLALLILIFAMPVFIYFS
jgi:hypothetical protein